MPDYSFRADFLNKFHTSDSSVQLLVILCFTYIIVQLFKCLKDSIVAFFRRKAEFSNLVGEPIFTLYNDPKTGRAELYHHPTGTIVGGDEEVF